MPGYAWAVDRHREPGAGVIHGRGGTLEATLLREVRFRAMHHYTVPGHSSGESEAVFGAQAHPHWHDWRVRFEINGPIDPATGWVMDLGVFDHVCGQVMAGWDGGDLNACVPEVRSCTMQPSTEALARWLYGRVSPEVPAPSRLVRVEVWESPELGACYPALGLPQPGTGP